MAKPRKLPFTQADVLRAFRMFAAGTDAPPGYIAADVLSDALARYCGGGRRSEEELRSLVGALEADSQGYVDYERAVAMFMAAQE